MPRFPSTKDIDVDLFISPMENDKIEWDFKIMDPRLRICTLIIMSNEIVVKGT